MRAEKERLEPSEEVYDFETNNPPANKPAVSVILVNSSGNNNKSRCRPQIFQQQASLDAVTQAAAVVSRKNYASSRTPLLVFPCFFLSVHELCFSGDMIFMFPGTIL